MRDLDADRDVRAGIDGVFEGINVYKDVVEGWFKDQEGEDEKRQVIAKEFMEIACAQCHKGLYNSEGGKVHQRMIEVFGPLEKIIKAATSIDKPGAIRDHYNHLFRVFLFSVYVYKKILETEPDGKSVQPEDIDKLAAAAAYHDMGYPIEKFEKTLMNVDFLRILGHTHSEISMKIVNPEIFLDILDAIGSQDDPDYKRIYRDVLCKALAGRGLYDTPHNLTSAVLFLQPLVEHADLNSDFWIGEDTKDSIVSVCDAIAYHGRNLQPHDSLCDIARAVRIADELQEWGRSNPEHSFINYMSIHESDDYVVECTLALKDKTKNEFVECSPEFSIADKIVGLATCMKGIKLKIDFNFPKELGSDFHDKLMERMENSNNDVINRSSVDLIDWRRLVHVDAGIDGRKVVVEFDGFENKVRVQRNV